MLIKGPSEPNLSLKSLRIQSDLFSLWIQYFMLLWLPKAAFFLSAVRKGNTCVSNIYPSNPVKKITNNHKNIYSTTTELNYNWKVFLVFFYFPCARLSWRFYSFAVAKGRLFPYGFQWVNTICVSLHPIPGKKIIPQNIKTYVKYVLAQ